MNQKELLYNFLVENNVLFNYLKYVSFDNPNFETESGSSLLSLITMTDCKIGWKITDEGYKYWDELHTKWVSFLEKYENKND